MNIFCYVHQNSDLQLALLTDDGKVFALPQQNFQQLIHEAKANRILPSQWIEDWLRTNRLLPLPSHFEELTVTTPVDAGSLTKRSHKIIAHTPMWC